MSGRNFGSQILNAVKTEKRKESKALRIAWISTAIAGAAFLVTTGHLYLQFLHRPNNLIAVAEPFAFKASFDTLYVPLTFINSGKRTNSVLSASLFQTPEPSMDSGRIIAHGVSRRNASFVIAPGEMKKLELLSTITRKGKRYVWLGFVTVTENGCKIETVYKIGFYSNPEKGFQNSGYVLNLLKEEQEVIEVNGILDNPIRL